MTAGPSKASPRTMERPTGPDTIETSADDDAALVQTLRDLIEDGQTLVQAEIAYQQSRAVYVWGRSKGIAALVVMGLGFGFFTLVALVIGLLLALTPSLGPWGALVAVGGGLGLITLLSLGIAILRFQRMRDVLVAKGDGE